MSNQRLQELFEEAHEWAVGELLSKHKDELKELKSKHFQRLVKKEEELEMPQEEQ